MLNYDLLSPSEGQIYKHRNGRLFIIICMARSSNDCTQEIVVYKSLDDTDYPKGQVWTRSLVEFSTPGRFKLVN